MEYLLQKAFESASQKYTPEQVAAILDKHQEVIEILLRNLFGWGLYWNLAIVLLFVVAIRSEINYRKLKRKIGQSPRPI
jgi:hypothetical protein